MIKFKNGDLVRLKKDMTVEELVEIGMDNVHLDVFRIERTEIGGKWYNHKYDNDLTLFTYEGFCFPISCAEVVEPVPTAQQKLDQLKKYFESGNDVPVQQATIKAKDFWAIYNS